MRFASIKLCKFYWDFGLTPVFWDKSTMTIKLLTLARQEKIISVKFCIIKSTFQISRIILIFSYFGSCLFLIESSVCIFWNTHFGELPRLAKMISVLFCIRKNTLIIFVLHYEGHFYLLVFLVQPFFKKSSACIFWKTHFGE